jgi:CheY-like chemotaxis protein
MGAIMLVCSKPSDEVEKCLLAAGYEVTRANDGEAAISQAQHAVFDMAVLVSTGMAMDVAETVFNLRDIRPTMQIIIMADRHSIEDDAPVEIIAHASPYTRVLTLDGLAAYLGIFRNLH